MARAAAVPVPGGAGLTDASRRSRRAEYARSVAALATGGAGRPPACGVRSVLAGVHLAVCGAMGVPRGDVVDELAGGERPADGAAVRPPPGEADPRLLGDVYEALLAPAGRRRLGAFYTPAAVTGRVVAWALDRTRGTPARGHATVCDPAAGAGSFLLAAADALVARGARRADVVRHHVFGADVDPLAASVSRAALTAWLGTGEAPPDSAVVTADVLGATLSTWSDAPAAGFDAVVGNPPFLGQLARRTARPATAAAAVRARFGAAAGPYTDTAALVLLVALDLVRPGGSVALLQPESVLATRDTEPVRRAVARAASLEDMWFAGDELFAAGVRVCVPVMVTGTRVSSVRVRAGRAGDVVSDSGDAAALAGAWGRLAAVAAGVPDPPVSAVGTLGDWCRATAGFRDEYYGLVPFVEDGGTTVGAGAAAVVTCGLVDPARCTWGRRPARFGRRSWRAPRVRLDALAGEPRLARWAAAQRVPKVLVATQTPVVEAVVDERGDLLGSTPVISVTCAPDRLWHAAAVLLSPVVTAWARRCTAGAALSAGGVKLSARQVLDAPVPPAGRHWDGAAAAARAAHEAARAGDAGRWRDALVDAAGRSCRAYGVDDGGELVAWWEARLPAWR